MATKRLPAMNIENARIINKNFRGEERRHEGRVVNQAGDRNFGVVIDDPEVAQQMADDGWNIKIRPPRDDDEGSTAMHWLPVKVGFNGYKPPRIVMVTERGKQTDLDEETVDILDSSEIIAADLTINPSPWDINGKTGIKAYLDVAYVTIKEDHWADKYSQN